MEDRRGNRHPEGRETLWISIPGNLVFGICVRIDTLELTDVCPDTLQLPVKCIVRATDMKGYRMAALLGRWGFGRHASERFAGP